MQRAGKFKVFPIFHPAAALYDGSKREALENDFATLGELLRASEAERAAEAAAKAAEPPHVEQPPLLYDLTALQKEANTRHGFSAEKTLGIAQELYEKKLITYPRHGEPLYFRKMCSRR